jgi:hypothetical protein
MTELPAIGRASYSRSATRSIHVAVIPEGYNQHFEDSAPQSSAQLAFSYQQTVQATINFDPSIHSPVNLEAPIEPSPPVVGGAVQTITQIPVRRPLLGYPEFLLALPKICSRVILATCYRVPESKLPGPTVGAFSVASQIGLVNQSLSEVEPPTGEPDAGNPPIRFGGRGSVHVLSTPSSQQEQDSHFEPHNQIIHVLDAKYERIDLNRMRRAAVDEAGSVLLRWTLLVRLYPEPDEAPHTRFPKGGGNRPLNRESGRRMGSSA